MPNTPATPAPTTDAPAPAAPAAGHHLAQLNVARLVAPIDSPQLAEFVAALPEINGLAEAAPGFVWRLLEDPDDPYATVPPAVFGPQYLVNLSVWRDADSLWDFVYRSNHMEMLRRRREWFTDPGRHSQVLWWVPAGTQPTEHDAAARLDHLRTHGPTPEAFTFRTRFPAPDTAER
ncbi:DUF3291 domain-containing protein [Uniformispora flossi]|uniref:DUF3291 domain-containing protein n=1 Tax=Uniformispora flossi TaxID=3390723 RepID=UPI003C2C175D